MLSLISKDICRCQWYSLHISQPYNEKCRHKHCTLLTKLLELQAYGDAVMDEAPMLFLSTYHVSIFLKRSPDVQDKRLWASTPIWWDQRDPPARVCWVYALMQSGDMFKLKQSLPRFAVPHTREGYHIFPTAEAGQPAKAPTRDLRKRRTAVSMLLQARNESGKGWELQRQYSDQADSSSDVSLPSEPASSSGTALCADPVILMEDLRVSDTLLGAGQFGHVLEVSQGFYTSASNWHLLAKSCICRQPKTREMVTN